jgi:hypothetical protein
VKTMFYRRAGYCVLTALLAMAPTSSFAYKEATHEKMSEEALNRSLLAQQSKRSSLGLSYPIDQNQGFPSSKGDPLSIVQLIRFGANFEDSGFRSFNHFFNPLKDQALTVFGIRWGNTSPNWALEDTGDDSGQSYSYKDARQYFYDALTKTDEKERKKNFGLLFQTLGQVVHHIQDMAQPQHVRNDRHLDEYSSAPYTAFELNPMYNPSQYERWVLDHQLGLTGYDTVNSSTDGFVLQTPRSLWINNDGKGIAEYTNRGFLSAGTLQKTSEFPSPDVAAMTQMQVSLQSLCDEEDANGRPACPAIIGSVTLFGNTVQDALRPGQTTFNARAATYSVLDQDLVKAGKKPVYALNRFNIDAAQQILLPRAVAYSTGLINMFFRAQMQISLPDEGVYGLVDHSAINISPGEALTTFNGFSKIKLKLSAPDTDSVGNPQTLTGGKLVAVLKFRRNRCWLDDLTGYPPYLTGGDSTTCRTDVEEVVLSDAQDNVAITSTPQPFSFNFSRGLPLNATDVQLQVVYRGTLRAGSAGESETDAVVVTTQDIGEPTFFAYMNASDYYTLVIDGQAKVFTRSEINGDPSKVALVQPQSCIDKTVNPWKLKPACLNPFDVKLGLTIGGSATSQPTRVDIDALPPKRLMRIAFLGDAGTKVALAQDAANTCYPHDPFQVDPIEWQLSYDGTGPMLKTPTLRKVRGVAQWYGTSCVGNADGLAPGTPDNRDEVMVDLDDKSPIAIRINGDAGF